VPDECARVQIPDDRNSMAFEIALRGFAGTPVRSERSEITDDQRFDVRFRGFFVVGVGPNVSDVRAGEAHGLPGITRIGENFLVTSEAGIKNDFAATTGASARREAVKDSSVLERQCGASFPRLRQRCLLVLSFRARFHGGN